MEPLYLPHLEERTLARFDELAKKEKIFYEEAVSELITVLGFNVSHTLITISVSVSILFRQTNPLYQFQATTHNGKQ